MEVLFPPSAGPVVLSADRCDSRVVVDVTETPVAPSLVKRRRVERCLLVVDSPPPDPLEATVWPSTEVPVVPSPLEALAADDVVVFRDRRALLEAE